MLNAATGSSSGLPARQAGAAAAAAAVVDDPRLVFAYTSVDYDVAEVLAGIGDALPGVPVIGNTSFTGVITADGFVGGPDGFIGVLVLGGDLEVGVAGLPAHGDARATGARAAHAALAAAGRTDPPAWMAMVAAPGEEETYLKGLSDVVGRVPLFGGSAADNSISGDWKLLSSDGVTSDGVAVAFLWTDAEVANLYTGAYRETSDVGIVTKVVGTRTLAEIDGKPALEAYAAWTGAQTDHLQGLDLLVATITSPLGVKDPLGDLVAIRHPMVGNPDDTMNLGSNIATGTAVIRMESTVDELIESTDATLAELQGRLTGHPVAYHLVHCGGRRAGIGDRIDEVAQRLRAQAGDVPFLCEFTFGEYGFVDDGRNTCGGLMLSFTGFAD